jgi:hypothetical protein
MRFRNIDAGTVGCKKKEQWQKTGMYMFKCKEKWVWMVRKKWSEIEINLDV